MFRDWRLACLWLLCLFVDAVPGLAMVQSGVVSVGNSATITFPKAFVSSPTVVCSAQNGSAIMAAPTQISKTSFKVLLRDTNNNTVSGAWVQWVAALPEPGVQCGTTTVSNGGTITFPTAFTSVPTIVTSGVQVGNPVMVTAINNARDKCGVWFATHAGSTSNTVAVYWIATVPRSNWRCGVTKYSDGASLSFSALSATPAIVTCGNCVGAVAAAAISNTASGATLSLRKHDNSAAGSAWVQWWAVPGGVASDAHCYRATWGYKYNNFSSATIPWSLYRDFFGASEVENADGSHKPSAQTWYDSTYKYVGSGGNCYGMSVSSLRLFFRAVTTFHRNWFASNSQPYAWLYPWQPQTRETAMEDQGGQLSAEMVATINYYSYCQSVSAACNRISSLLSSSTDRPVIGFKGQNWGHAVVPYKITASGNSRTVCYWDNNRAYATNETCGDDPDKGTANVSTGAISFQTGSYTATQDLVCMSYSECVRTPHLPSSAQSSTSGVAVVAMTGGATMGQVENERGQRLLGANGEMLSDRARRIPESLKFTPFTGTTPLKNFPGLFFFSSKSGNTISFTCKGTGSSKSLLLYSPGRVCKLAYAGAGKISSREILSPDGSLEIPDVGLLKPQEIELILTAGDERVLTLRNLAVAGKLLHFRHQRGGLEITSAGAWGGDLQVVYCGRGGMQRATFRALKALADRSVLLVPGYEGGRPTSLLMETRSGPGAPLLDSQTLRPSR